MANAVRQDSTSKGITIYTVTIGTTYYQRTEWTAIIDILNARRKDIPAIDAGYGQGRYAGD